MTNKDGRTRQAASTDRAEAHWTLGLARIAQSSAFWLACAGIFTANSLLSAVQARWLHSAVGLITAGLAVIAALASWHSGRSRQRPLD
jgi:hypothetical protein